VQDNVTGLIWEIKDNKDGTAAYANPHDADNIYTWFDDNASRNGGEAGKNGEGTDTTDFIVSLNTEAFGGFKDWRMPTAQELSRILDRGAAAAPYIDVAYFPHMVHEYWTSTTDPTSPEQSATLLLDNGQMNFPSKISTYSAIAVRGALSLPLFYDNGDGTINDLTTGLMWQKQSTAELTWQQALAFCEALSLAGYSDWRMPNINELQSLVDYSKSMPSIDAAFFPDTDYHYWSSTTFTTDPGRAYYDCFLRGRIEGYNKLQHSNIDHVRAVRGGIISENDSTTTTTTTLPSTTTIPGNLCPVELVYGEHAAQTDLVRQYSREVLETTGYGRAFIDLYYLISPMVARQLQGCEALEEASRAILDPFILLLASQGQCREHPDH